MTIKPARGKILTLCSLCVASMFLGCTPAQESEAAADLQIALSNLVQNRALTEQFVRDVKATGDSADPAYSQAVESYQNARETYDRFLDTVEMGKQAKNNRSLRGATATDVENASADFLADATAVLRPRANTRRIPFQRAVILPENLIAQFSRLPKRARDKIIDRFDDQVRWKTWSQI